MIPIRVGQHVRDRISGIAGLVVERDWYRPGLRPIRCADGRELAIDEWRLVADDFSVLRRAGRACWRFLRSDLGSPSPIPLGVIGAIAVWLVSVLRCHYQ